MWRNRRFRIIAIVVLILIAGGVIWFFLRPRETVEVVRPQRREVVELVIASGRLRAVRESDVGTEVSGTVEKVLVEEGDKVVKGQTVITLERADARQRVQQARLALQTAKRQLELTERGALPEDVARARAELRQAERVGTARLEAARERLADLERGGRPAERRAAEAELNRARASLAQAESDLRRMEQLFDEGAIAEAEVDRARTAVKEARAVVNAAQEQLRLAEEPASPEEIRAARAQVREAQAALEESVRVARANLERLLAEPRAEDVRLARARVEEARAALSAAEEELAKRTIRAPINGVVVNRSVEPGQSVTPGTRLLTIADMSRTEIYVETDESNLPKLAIGQTATVIAPAYSNRPFTAVVTRIGPEVDPARGIIAVRLRPLSLPAYARPDMTVDASIQVARLPDALSVPVSSVVEDNGRAYVLVVEGGRARRRNVEILARGSRWVGVKGVSPDARVVVDATQVSAGAAVRAVEAK